MVKHNNEALIHQQYKELVAAFPELSMCQNATGQWVIRGTLAFSATFNDVTITDAFEIFITLPDDYPSSPPIVQETSGRIPDNYHQYYDRTLCLGAPVEVRRRFKEKPSLLSFVKTMVVEYFYGYAHLEQYGTLPFGELTHGCKGIREYYQDKFNTNNVHTIFALLNILLEAKYRGHFKCPCGSGQIIRKCHGPVLLNLISCQTPQQYVNDFRNVLFSVDKSELEQLNWNLVPEDLKREIDEMARTRANREKCA